MLRLGGEAYSVALVLELEATGGREVAQAAVFIALRRLEEKGLSSSRLDDHAVEEAGRVRRYFKWAPEALRRMKDMRKTLVALWKGVEPLLDEGQPRMKPSSRNPSSALRQAQGERRTAGIGLTSELADATALRHGQGEWAFPSARTRGPSFFHRLLCESLAAPPRWHSACRNTRMDSRLRGNDGLKPRRARCRGLEADQDSRQERAARTAMSDAPRHATQKDAAAPLMWRKDSELVSLGREARPLMMPSPSSLAGAPRQAQGELGPTKDFPP